MAVFITLGDSDELQIRVPIDGQTGWGPQLIEEFIKKLVEHDHSGTDGKGVPISGAGLAADSIAGDKLRLLNEEYLRSRNAADSGDVNIIRVNSDDEIEFGATLAPILIPEGTIDTFSANSVDSNTAIIDDLTSDIVKTSIIEATAPAIAAPNDTITNSTVVICSATQTATVSYKIVRGTSYQSGVLECIGSTNELSDEFVGTDLGVTFSLSGTNELIITTTDNVDDATVTYTINRR